MSTPYIGFGNDTLAQCDPLNAGDTVACPKCGRRHMVRDSAPPGLLFYTCGESTYMAGINGRSTMGVKADCKGRI